MSLEWLHSQLSSKRSSLQSEKQCLKEYEAKAKKLGDLYDKMKDKKSEMKTMKKDMSKFADETYDGFKGNLFNERYVRKIEDELVDDKYVKIIDIIDNNLDNINNEKTKYENKVLRSKGIIGSLEASINSLITRIENWIN